MRRTPNVFEWEQEPALDRSERLSRRNLHAAAPPAPRLAPAAVATDLREKAREAPNCRDLVLSPLAIQWCATLPPDVRPVLLCDRYPRIANRLALSWKDRALTQLVLDSLFQDKRGGRRGFAPEIALELRRLRQEISGAPGRRVAAGL